MVNLKKDVHELSQQLLSKEYDSLSPHEQHVIRHISRREQISRNVLKEHEETSTVGQRTADLVASFGGSWPFIILFFAMMIFWIGSNSYLLVQWKKHIFDPYPFILLNLVLSMLAAIQAPIIMMSQNRQAQKDRLDAAHDYEVNLKA
jgi:uncharacterized membrane protein